MLFKQDLKNINPSMGTASETEQNNFILEANESLIKVVFRG
jgi:hypothetical protein